MQLQEATIKKIDPTKKYMVFLGLPSKMKEEDKQKMINKIELAFKTFGIKNVKCIAEQVNVLEVQ